MGEDGIRSGFSVVKLPADYRSHAVNPPPLLSAGRIASALLVQGLSTFIALTVVAIYRSQASPLSQHLPEIALVAAVWSIIGAIRLTQTSCVDPSRRPIAIVGLSLMHFLANCMVFAIFLIAGIVAWAIYLFCLFLLAPIIALFR